MSKCVIAGVFDPFTKGHEDLILRAAKQFDKVVVAVSDNASKNPVLDGAKRTELVKKAIEKNNISVVRMDGLLADFCIETGADCIVKGVRSTDFTYEYEMFLANNALCGIETMFLPAKAEFSFLSSTLVRELIKLRKDISAFVPEEIAGDVLSLYNIAQKEGARRI